jgi:nucleotide-binding universal stress UspA family protein
MRSTALSGFAMLRAVADVIVTGYDGKEHAERVLAKAIDLAQGGELVVVVDEYVPVDPTYAVVSYAPQPATIPVVGGEEDVPSALEPLVEKARDQLTAAGAKASFVWGVGDPARRIVETAKDVKAAKIVIGADHHSFFGKLFGEDVEAEVRREAGCEVVIVQ